jgi:hypothetical protein
MNALSEEILRKIQQYAADAKKPRSKKNFREPVYADFAPDTQILCIDQTLTHCGWALLNTEDGSISVEESGTIRSLNLGNGVQGFERTFTKAVALAGGISEMLTRLYGQWAAVVLEMPSVAGYRTESSLVAASTICTELSRMGEGLPVLVSRQAAGAALCGDRFAPKRLSSDLVNRLVEDRRPRGPGQWTEHVRDAVLVGLKHLYLEEK